MRTRDEDELVDFVAACAPGWQRLACLLTGNWHDAEDVVAASVVRLYKAWPRVATADDPHAYAHRVVVNESNRWLRRSRRVLPLTVLSRETAEIDDLAGREAMWEAIKALPTRQRAVVVLRYYLDWSERDIAVVLKCSPGTIKSQSSKALARLRAELTDDPELQESAG